MKLVSLVHAQTPHLHLLALISLPLVGLCLPVFSSAHGQPSTLHHISQPTLLTCLGFSKWQEAAVLPAQPGQSCPSAVGKKTERAQRDAARCGEG